jgi:hypothetical protein
MTTRVATAAGAGSGVCVAGGETLGEGEPPGTTGGGEALGATGDGSIEGVALTIGPADAVGDASGSSATWPGMTAGRMGLSPKTGSA